MEKKSRNEIMAMAEAEVIRILSRNFRKRSTPLRIPSDADWRNLQDQLNWIPPTGFRFLMSHAPEFHFEGGLLLVADNSEALGDDTILTVFLAETAIGGWDIDWVPFYDFGNGDLYIISKVHGTVSCVRHGGRECVQVGSDIEEWLLRIPEY